MSKTRDNIILSISNIIDKNFSNIFYRFFWMNDYYTLSTFKELFSDVEVFYMRLKLYDIDNTDGVSLMKRVWKTLKNSEKMCKYLDQIIEEYQKI